MSTYVEVHCDVKKEGRDPASPLHSFCWSDRNDNPQGWSIADAKAEARIQGWKLTKGNRAACPNCRSKLEPFWYPQDATSRSQHEGASS